MDVFDDPSLGTRRRWELLALRSKKLQADIADQTQAIANFGKQRVELAAHEGEQLEGDTSREERLQQIDAYLDVLREQLAQSTAEYGQLQPRLDQAKAALQSDIREFLEEAVAHSGLPPATLARRAAVSASTITRPLNDREFSFIPRSTTLQKIADAAGIPLPRSFTAGRPDPIPDGPEIRIVPIAGEATLGSWRPEPDMSAEAEAWDRGDWAPVNLTEYASTPLSAYRIRSDRDELSIAITAPREATGIRLDDEIIVRRWRGSFSETALWRVVAANPLRAVAEAANEGMEELQLEARGPEERAPQVLGVVIQTIRHRSPRGPLIG